MTPEVRNAIYAVAATLLTLFAALGWLVPGGPDVWLALLNTLINLGGALGFMLAKKHIPDAPDADSGPKHLHVQGE